VIIDVGHGGVDGGTSYQNLLEKDINLQIGKLLYEQLAKKKIQVVLNRTGDYALSDENRWLASRSRHRKDLAQRKELSEEISSRMLLSLHVNWSRSSSESGPIVLHQRTAESFSLAYQIQDRLNDYYGTKNWPRVGRSYYMLNRTNLPAVIIEMGFISNNGDRAKLTNPKQQKKIARCISSAVIDYLVMSKGAQ
jgi:N-acetylmuramoyl-L-alanine amidase